MPVNLAGRVFLSKILIVYKCPCLRVNMVEFNLNYS